MTWMSWLLTVVLVGSAMSGEILVAEYNCGKTIYLDSEENSTLTYNGAHLSTDPCKFKYKPNDVSRDICIENLAFNLPCNIKVVYNEAYYSILNPDKTFTCYDSYVETWCPSLSSSVYIGFEKRSGSSIAAGRTQFRIYIKPSVTSDIISGIGSFFILLLKIAGVGFGIFVVIAVVVFVMKYFCHSNIQLGQNGAVRQNSASTSPFLVQSTTTPVAFPLQSGHQAVHRPQVPQHQPYQTQPSCSFPGGQVNTTHTFCVNPPQLQAAYYQPPPLQYTAYQPVAQPVALNQPVSMQAYAPAKKTTGNRPQEAKVTGNTTQETKTMARKPPTHQPPPIPDSDGVLPNPIYNLDSRPDTDRVLPNPIYNLDSIPDTDRVLPNPLYNSDTPADSDHVYTYIP